MGRCAGGGSVSAMVGGDYLCFGALGRKGTSKVGLIDVAASGRANIGVSGRRPPGNV